MPDWVKIKAEYIRGGTSYRKLAQKYGISASQLTRVARKEGWYKLQKQAQIKADAIMVKEAAKEEAKRADKISGIADVLLDMIAAGIKDGSISLNTRSLRDVTGALKDIKDIKGIRNELDIQEQIERIKKLKKETENGDKDKTQEIKVVFSPDVSELCK